ncbi:hypothetical protein AgCh_002750 [Apium graveolens]
MDYTMLVSRDVIFNENIFPMNNVDDSYLHLLPMQMPAQNLTSYSEDPEMEPEIQDHEDDELQTSPQNDASPPEEMTLRRSARVSKQPTWLQDYISRLAANIAAVTDHYVTPEFTYFLEAIVKTPDPLKFSDAVKHPHWKAYHPDGTIERRKARLVILGRKQKYGMDYMEIFAPVAKMATVRALFAVAVMQDWNLYQMDVKNTFLHGELEETVYMKLPEGYTGLGSRISAQDGKNKSNIVGNLVCRLKKALYGLRQALRLWFSKLAVTLKKSGYSQSKNDYSLFTQNADNSLAIILVYVDDILITGNSETTIKALNTVLCKKFHMKDMGSASYFLRLEITRNEAGIFVSRNKYTEDMLKEFGMTNVSPLRLSMDVHVKLSIDKGEPLANPHEYQRLMGKLIYLTVIRPDLTFFVYTLTYFMHNPTSIHMQS